MMNLCMIFLIVSSTFLLSECLVKPGVQMRLTKTGMQYVIDVGRKILKKELEKQSLDASGRSGDIEYRLSGMHIRNVGFSTTVLKPVPNVGIQAVVSGIRLQTSGNVWYKYKKGWFKFSDNVDLSVSISNSYIDLIASVQASPNGHPEIDLHSCSANIADVDLKFHGGVKAWIYNLFRHIIEKKLRNSLNSMLCKLVRKEIDEKAKSELQTFPVVKKLDRWALIDYRLTQSPVFTSDYMHAFFKGEFKSVLHHKESSLVPPSLKLSRDHDKMLYFWVTNYTLNTAGEVYQGSNQFDIMVKAWDEKVPASIRKNLNTKVFAYVIPNLAKYYNLPMSVRLVSYKSSRVVINEGDIHLYLYAHATFSVKYNNQTVSEVFQIRFDIDTTLNVKVVNEKITGEITEFKYDAKIISSNIGKITTELDAPLIKLIIETTIISRANPKLKRGFPLPRLDGVAFKNLDITLHKSVIRIGSDFTYVKTNIWRS